MISSVFNIAKQEIAKFDWQKIMEVSNSLSDFNSAQWRFLKAYIIEICIEKYSNGNLQYVSDVHRDYYWSKLDISIELKSMTSLSMCRKNGHLRKNYSILLNNSMGTNKKTVLDKSEISDIIMVIYSDGIFIVDKDTALKHTHFKGDGFSLILPREKITFITKFDPYIRNSSELTLKQDIIDLIRDKL